MISHNDFQKNELEKIATFKTFLFAVRKFHCCSHYFNNLGKKSSYGGLAISNAVENQQKQSPTGLI